MHIVEKSYRTYGLPNIKLSSIILGNIAAIGVVFWGLGFFLYEIGPEVHILLAAAMVLLIVQVLLGK